MIKAKELRIGNYVEFYQKPIKCGIITLNQLDCDSGKKYEIKPIPLTEDWLIRFGFEKRMINGLIPSYTIDCTPKGYKNDYVLDFWFGQFKDTPKGVCDSQSWKGRITSGTSHDFGIKYIHQLQNLYFALTGEELTIKE
jgi:hypothetical protein